MSSTPFEPVSNAPPNAARAGARLGERLVQAGVLDPAKLGQAIERQRLEGGWFGDVVLRLGLCSEQDLLRVLANDYRTRFVLAERLAGFRIAERTLGKVPQAHARRLWLVPLAFDDATQLLHVVAAVPPEAEARSELLANAGAKDLMVYVATRMSVDAMIRKHYQHDPYAFSWLDGPAPSAPPDQQITAKFDEGAKADVAVVQRELARLKLAEEFRRRIAGERDVEKLPARVLAVLLDLFPADGGAVLLQRGTSVRRSRNPQARVEVSRTVLAEIASKGEGVLFGDVERDPRMRGSDSLVIRSVKSVLGMPLRGNAGLLGVIYLEAVADAFRFTRDHLEQLQDLARVAVEALELAEEFDAFLKESASRTHLSRFLSPTLVEQAIRGNLDLSLEGARRSATVLVVGITGLTKAAATHRSPRELVRDLNELFDRLASVIHEEGGALDRLGARGVSAVFGAPVRHPDEVARALTCATRIAHEATAVLADGGPRIGVGVHTGDLVFGALGPSRRRDLTAFGQGVDVASRLGYAAGAAEILVTRATAALARGFRFEARPIPQRQGEPVLEVLRLVAQG